jgi:hypothetical protein
MAIVNDMMRRKRLNELISSWVEYRDMIARHAGQGQATPEQERKFLDLKAEIAARIPLLQEFSGHGGLNQELQGHVRGMTDLMNRYLTLNPNGQFTDAEREDFMSRWHAHFLYLNRFKGMQGQPQAKQKSRLHAAPMSGSNPYATWGGRRLITGMFDNWMTRFVIRASIIVILVTIAVRLTNFDFANAGESVKRIRDQWWGPSGSSNANVAVVVPDDAAKKPGTSGTGADNASTTTKPPSKPTTGRNAVIIGPGSGERPKHSVDGSGVFKPPQGANPLQKAVAVIRDITPRPLREFMRPVTNQWGVEATVAMVGVGLLLVAYMLFGRAR